MFIQWVTGVINYSVLELWSDALGACTYSRIVRTDRQPVVDIATSHPHTDFALSSAPNMAIAFESGRENS